MVYKTLEKNIRVASEAILNGGIIIYPTDTIYGFGVDATNSTAIKDLNNLKGRVEPYSIIVDSFKMLKKYSEISKAVNEKLETIFPGPYTAILQKKESNLSKLITLDLDTIGIRIPKTDFISKVVTSLNKPIVTTSVNKHGEESINSIEEIMSKYNSIDTFIDKENIPSKASTIIDFTQDPYKVIRKGYGDYRV